MSLLQLCHSGCSQEGSQRPQAGKASRELWQLPPTLARTECEARLLRDFPEPSRAWPVIEAPQASLGSLHIVLPAPDEVSEILVPACSTAARSLGAIRSSGLALGSPLQEPQLSLGCRLHVGEPGGEPAGAFPLFIRNTVLGQKQPKRARAEPCRSTDVVSGAPHKWQVPALGWGWGARSPHPSALGKDRL